MGAVQALQRANQSTSLLTTWAWSGYVPYAWPGRHAVFNPLEFTPAEVHALGETTGQLRQAVTDLSRNLRSH